MAWMKFDLGVPTHPKIIAATRAGGFEAGWLWFSGNCHCRRYLTDGVIAELDLASLAPHMPEKAMKRAVAGLVAAQLWHVEPGGYRVHDFLDWNPSKGDVQEAKAKDAARKKAGLQTEESVRTETDSGRIPDGIQTDSGPTRAGGRSSPSSLRLDGVGSSERGVGRTRPGGRGLIVSPAAFDRQHGSHVPAFCDFVCLPQAVFDGFVGRVINAGATEADAIAQVTAWAYDVRDAWRGRIPGDDIFVFWRNEWAATHGSNAPAKGVDVTAGLRGI